MMGKVKKPIVGVMDGQKKISNFFQKISVQESPTLFSEIGKLDAGGSHKISLRHANSAFNEDLEDFVPDNFQKTLGKSKSTKRTSVSAELDCSNTDFENKNKNIASKIEPVFIPETQFRFMTPGSNYQIDENARAIKYSSNDILDSSIIIPDTPEDKYSMPKCPMARSFLFSVAQINSNPIKKAKENRELKLAMKKRIRVARKHMTSTSVQFSNKNNQTSIDNSLAIQNKLTDQDTNDIYNKSVNNEDINIKCCDIERASNMLEYKCTDKSYESKTPTKMYCDGSFLKRMAQSGCSPLSKRSSDVFKNEKKLNDEALCVKKQLELNVNAMEVEQMIDSEDCHILDGTPKVCGNHADLSSTCLENNDQEDCRNQELNEIAVMKMQTIMEKDHRNKRSEKIIKYQLSGGADQLPQEQSTISVHNDSTLVDILLELNSPSLIAGHSKALTRVKPSRKMSLDRTTGKASETKVTNLTDQCKNSASNEATVSSQYSQWSKEDEKYFSKLGVNVEHEPPKFSVKMNASKNAHTIMKQEFCENNMLNLQKKVKRDLANVVPTVGCIVDSNDINIEMYPTQCVNICGRSRSHIEETEVEEFDTQLISSQSICNDVKNFSPFKSKCDGDIYHKTDAPCDQYFRFTVTGVEHDRNLHQTVLTLKPKATDFEKKCYLQGFWCDSHVEVGDIVHIVGHFTDNVCYITDRDGLLIVNPDLLLSGTSIVSSIFCMRRSILKEKFMGCESGNIQMLYGSIIHSVFQQMLKKQLFTEDQILQEAVGQIRKPKNMLEIYGNNVSEKMILEEIKSYIPQMISWVKQYTNFGGTNNTYGNACSEIQITKLCDIEENIWSPRFGIKGKIDLTVEATLKKEVCLLPVEIKTGKTSFSVEHMGQVSLYSMMFADRKRDHRKGLLLYLKELSMRIIPAEHSNQKGLVQLRNEMAYYISRQVVKTFDDSVMTFTLGRLPDPITNTRACQKCPQLVNCAIYQRQVETRPDNGSGVYGLVSDTLGHLTSDHMTYFSQWCLMLDLESQVDRSKKTVSNIWCKSSSEREDNGLCLSGMVLSVADCYIDYDQDMAVLVFVRHPNHYRNAPLSSIGVTAHDCVVISRERPAWIAMSNGFVHKISSTCIHVLIDRDAVDRLMYPDDQVFCIDRCDSFTTVGILYTNISKLMMDDFVSKKLRQLLIERKKPEFINTLSKGQIEKAKFIFKTLNKPQKTAILKAMMCKDYVLITGYPGTGKTSTIVALVKILHVLGLSVLLTSYTHSAVDNILLKLKKDNVKFLRIGKVSKLHPDIQEFSVDVMTKNFTCVSEVDELFMSQKIVATSCLGINHPIFTHRTFDVCLVDEASQILQPACLGPLFSCARFILVGDPKQLPPVVQSKEARDLGMNVSLFALLDGLGATFELNLQYRMNSEIMQLSNTLVYQQRLKCGNETVAGQTLHLPHQDIMKKIVDNEQWMSGLFDDSLEKSVIFLDTCTIPAVHTKIKMGGYRNDMEASIVVKIISNLCKAGADSKEIGVIAPYRSQVFNIKEKMHEGDVGANVEINTVDQYQGRDKQVIIISFVMSSTDKDVLVGELLQDKCRLNVALTRARLKLILIGNSQSLCQYEPIEQLIHLLRENKQIYNLS